MAHLIRDIAPREKEFFRVFEKIAYRHQYSSVFDDYLTMLINWFANGELKEQRDQALQKYDDKEKQLFNQLYIEHVKIMEDAVIKHGHKWYDALGNIYQTISSNSKASSMGQFFTPSNVVDMMASMVIGTGSKPYQFINEPCSGSGRMILSVHAIQPLNYYWAIDLDDMCAKMTAINMCFHNAAGVVSHGNALWIDEKFYKSYYIKRVQIGEHYLPYLSILNLDQTKLKLHEISEYCKFMQRISSTEPVPEIPDINPEDLFKSDNITTEVKDTKLSEILSNTTKIQGSQLSLF